MSHRGIAWAWEQTVTTTSHRATLLALGELHGHFDGICRGALETLAAMTCLSHRQVRRVVRELADLGHIRIEEGSGRRTHRYVLIGLDQAAEPARSGDMVSPLAPEPADRSEDTMTPLGGHHVPPGGTPCPPHLVLHRVEHQQQQSDAAAAAPISVREFHPPDDLVTALSEERPDLNLDDVLVGFRGHTWRRRRTADEWVLELVNWVRRQTAPEPAAPPVRDATWIRQRIEVLLALSPDGLAAQLAGDPAMRALFDDAGGPAGVARLSLPELVNTYHRRGRPPAPMPSHRPLDVVPWDETGHTDAR